LLDHLSPYVRVAWDNYANPPWMIRERVIFDYEILYLKQGKIIVTVNDSVYHGTPGDIFIFKPKEKHSIRLIGDEIVRQPHVHFDLIYEHNSPQVNVSFKPLEEMSEYELTLFREDQLSLAPLQLPNYFHLSNPLPFEKMLFDLIHEFEQKLPFYKINTQGKFIELLVYILREHQWQTVPHVQSNLEQLICIQHYLNRQTEREVTLEELSVKFNISKYYLIRLFKSAFGMSPIQYHQMARIRAAKQMIQFTNTPLTQISHNFGYSSIHSFSRAFKNIEGVAPSFYRNR
jgi:AraC-like DNA-binding protein